MLECSKCGASDNELEYRYVSDGAQSKLVCELCLIDMNKIPIRTFNVADEEDCGYECAACGTTDDAKSYTHLEDDKWYCDECAQSIEEQRTTCARCENDDITVSYIERGGKWYCSKCCAAERVASGEIYKDVRCTQCGATTDKFDYEYHDGCWYCKGCIEVFCSSIGAVYVPEWDSWFIVPEENVKPIKAHVKIEEVQGGLEDGAVKKPTFYPDYGDWG